MLSFLLTAVTQMLLGIHVSVSSLSMRQQGVFCVAEFAHTVLSIMHFFPCLTRIYYPSIQFNRTRMSIPTTTPTWNVVKLIRVQLRLAESECGL